MTPSRTASVFHHALLEEIDPEYVRRMKQRDPYANYRKDVLNRLRTHSMQSPSLPCCVIAGRDLLLEDDDSLAEKLIVVPLCGFSSTALEYEDGYIYADVHPKLDGSRIACLMVAKEKEKVALSLLALDYLQAEAGEIF